MELPWLYSFTVLADLLQFGRAAAALHMSQSALLAFSVTPRDSSIISAAGDGPLGLGDGLLQFAGIGTFRQIKPSFISGISVVNLGRVDRITRPHGSSCELLELRTLNTRRFCLGCRNSCLDGRPPSPATQQQQPS